MEASRSLTLTLHPIETVHPNQSWNLEIRIYEQAVSDRRGNFTPLVASVDDFSTEARHFWKRLAAQMGGKPYSQTCGYVKGAIIRASSLCLRGLMGKVEKWTWVQLFKKLILPLKNNIWGRGSENGPSAYYNILLEKMHHV